MNSTGVVVTYVGQTHDGRLVNFTLTTPDESTGAPSHTGTRSRDNYTYILVVVLVCVLGPLILAIVILAVVIVVVKKVCHSPVFLLIFPYPPSSTFYNL